MESVQTIDGLVEALKNTEQKNYVNKLKNMDIPLSAFEEYEYWDSDKYTRNCIARTDKFELMLLCWSPHQDTPVHCHGGQKCWVYQLDNNLTEIRYDQLQNGALAETQKMKLSPGKLTYMDDSMGFHKLQNQSDQKAMTIHLYMNPIDECRIYNEKKQQFEYTSLEYDTVDGELLKISA